MTKFKHSRLFVFNLCGDYANGMIVVVAKSLEAAQQVAFERVSKHDRHGHIYGITAASQFTEYVILPMKDGDFAESYYSE